MKYQDKEPLFSISIAAKITGISPRLLRSYEEAQLLTPYRTEGKTRLYSQRDIRWLQIIKYLHKEREVNLPGIKIILALLSPDLSEKTEAELMEKIREVAPDLLAGTRKRKT